MKTKPVSKSVFSSPRSLTNLVLVAVGTVILLLGSYPGTSAAQSPKSEIIEGYTRDGKPVLREQQLNNVYAPLTPECENSWSLTSSLYWAVAADWDLHLQTPTAHIYYGNMSADGFTLDRDANPACAPTPLPPEQITGMGKCGTYTLYSNLYSDCGGSPPITFSATVTALKPITINGTSYNIGQTFHPQNGVAFTVAANSPSPTPTPLGPPPVPTYAPLLAEFPPPNLLFNNINPFILQYDREFDLASAAYLAAALEKTRPLINPGSGSNLKPNARNTASGITGVFTAYGVITAVNEPTQLSAVEAVFPFMDLTPDQERNIEIGAFAEAFIASWITENPVPMLIYLNHVVYEKNLVPQLQQIAVDPPDSDYQQIVIPDAVQVPQFPTSGNPTLDAAITKSHSDVLLAQSFLKAANISYNRYSSAYAAGEPIYAGLQLEAILYFLSLYDKAIRDSAADLSALVPLVIASGGGDETFNAQALTSLQADIAANGLPPEVTQFFTDLGFTTSQLDVARTRLLAVNPQTISGTMLGSTVDMAVDARRVSTQAPGATDANRDGKPDYVLYKLSTRQTAVWYLNNSVYQSGAYGPTVPTGWTLIDTADFNGDGKPDYALFNASTRQTAIWYLNNNVYVNGVYGRSLPSGWQLTATGDLNGDGKQDYVLYNGSTRQTAIWYLNNNVYTGSNYGPTLPVGWQVVRVADFNFDGKPDYLLFNSGTRQSAIWYLNNNVYVSGAYGPTIASGYQLRGAADFNGDAKPDYALFNTTTLQTAIWYLNNNVYVSGAYGPTLPAGWSLVAP